MAAKKLSGVITAANFIPTWDEECGTTIYEAFLSSSVSEENKPKTTTDLIAMPQRENAKTTLEKITVPKA